jgi:hypothetical protein
MSATDLDPTDLALADLRAERARLQTLDDAVSYVRRLAQARLDLAAAETTARSTGEPVTSTGDVTGELPRVLGSHLTGGAARPPRPAEEFSEHPLAIELDELCSDAGSADLPTLTDEQLADYVTALTEFEHRVSVQRKQVFERLDALSAELVRRYRDGEASVAGLLDD